MSEIVIKDSWGIPCISIGVEEYYSDIRQFKCNVRINFKDYNAYSTVYNELTDMQMLKDALSRMKNVDNASYEYRPMIYENFSISFTRNLLGIVKVRCVLNNEDYSCQLVVEFEIDQTFLQEICDQIDDVVASALESSALLH